MPPDNIVMRNHPALCTSLGTIYSCEVFAPYVASDKVTRQDALHRTVEIAVSARDAARLAYDENQDQEQS